ncbi:ATP-binding protein [Streptomyces marispadix]|uniref:DNA topoisomerase (ATP-hydrolyzing) n=1 Tax=Streptomyces marispadix TaxID=2922868 RepID=A0ABS9SWZ6_9ACTN|nr:ATP-binding protein [Streptomyces marispadix]MCH6160780.1 ATP-binding protein [Streptomyces marispadix]
MEMRPRASWRNTTHDWASTVDLGHLRHIRRDPGRFAPGGVRHLILEVVAYAADEAECGNGGRCLVTLHPDGSVSVADDGRGTDTRLDDHGVPVKKPIMATKDLRFFDRPDRPDGPGRPGAQSLPDGHPRRGMSVVAVLSSELIHTNRRRGGAWTQRYEYGVPVSDLEPIAHDGTTGTTVRFRPGACLPAANAANPANAPSAPSADELAGLVAAWPHLAVDVRDKRRERRTTAG